MIGITERGDAALDLSWKQWTDSGKPAILITKDPAKLACHISSTDNVVVHCTITGYGGSKLEPSVPLYQDAITGMIDVYDKLSGEYGDRSERVVLRIDPIIPTLKGVLTAMSVLREAKHKLGQCWSRRVRISFLDNYSHVQTRFSNNNLPQLDYDFHAPLNIRQEIYELIKSFSSYTFMYDVEVCGEPGMTCTGCVSSKDCNVLGITSNDLSGKQRPICKCLSCKHELLKNRQPCAHGCLYCYWKD